MIVVDTSALMAVILNESGAEACIEVLENEDELVISAATLAEALIVAARRNVGRAMELVIESLGMEIVSVTAASARRSTRAYEQWGKGRHPAGLNYGDCYSYELAKERGCRLLCVGDDFAQTDLRDDLAPTGHPDTLRNSSTNTGGSPTRIRT